MEDSSLQNIRNLLNVEFKGNNIGIEWLQPALKFLVTKFQPKSEEELYDKVKHQYLRAKICASSYPWIPSNDFKAHSSYQWKIEYVLLEVKEIKKIHDNAAEIILTDGTNDVVANIKYPPLRSPHLTLNAKISLRGDFTIDKNIMNISMEDVVSIHPLETPIKKVDSSKSAAAVAEQKSKNELMKILEEELLKISPNDANFLIEEDIDMSIDNKRKCDEDIVENVQRKKLKKGDLILNIVYNDLNDWGLLDGSYIPKTLTTNDRNLIWEYMRKESKIYSGISQILNELPSEFNKTEIIRKFNKMEIAAEKILKNKTSVPSNNSDTYTNLDDMKFEYKEESFEFIMEAGKSYGVEGKTKSFTGFVITNLQNLNPHFNDDSTKTFQVITDESERLYYFNEHSKFPDYLSILKDIMNISLINGCLKWTFGVTKIHMKQLGDLYGVSGDRNKNNKSSKYKLLGGVNFIAIGPAKCLFDLEQLYIKVGEENGVALNVVRDLGGIKKSKLNNDDLNDDYLAVLFAAELNDPENTVSKMLLNQSIPTYSCTPLMLADISVLTKYKMQAFKSCSSCTNVFFNNEYNYYNHTINHNSSKYSFAVDVNKDGIKRLNKLDIIEKYVEEYKKYHQIQDLAEHFRAITFLSGVMKLSIYENFFLGVLNPLADHAEVKLTKKDDSTATTIVYKPELKAYFISEANDVSNNKLICYKHEEFVKKMNEIIQEVYYKKKY